MIKKSLLESVIQKYYLDENESVKWSIVNNVLNVDFTSKTKEIIGSITCENILLEDCELAIYDTKKLLNLLKITEEDLQIHFEKNQHLVSKMFISDSNYELVYALADPILIGKNGTVNEPEWDVVLPLSKTNIEHLIKAKSALSEATNMLITYENTLKQPTIVFTFGDEQGHNNKINYSVSTEKYTGKLKLPFNAIMFKNILASNKDLNDCVLCINSKGLLKFTFKSAEINSVYYLVRKENNI
jgi:hypothetical protein